MNQNQDKPKPFGLVMVGTDTGVGKTFCTALLLNYLIQKGIAVAGMKPFESGPAQMSDHEQMMMILSQQNHKSWPKEWVCPYRFADPLAPAQAAHLAQKDIDLEVIRTAFGHLSQLGWVIVEGVGGLMVPLLPENPAYTVANLIQDVFQLPIIIVARAGLGTLNHTILTLEQCKALGLEVLGVLLNETQDHRESFDRPDISVALNRQTLESICKVPLWGPLPYIPGFAPNKSDFVDTIHHLLKQPQIQQIFKEIFESISNFNGKHP